MHLFATVRFPPKKVKGNRFLPIVLTAGAPPSFALPRGKLEASALDQGPVASEVSHRCHFPITLLKNVPAGQGRTRMMQLDLHPPSRAAAPSSGDIPGRTTPRPPSAAAAELPSPDPARRHSSTGTGHTCPCPPSRVGRSASFGLQLLQHGAAHIPSHGGRRWTQLCGLTCFHGQTQGPLPTAVWSSASESPSPPQHVFNVQNDKDILDTPKRPAGGSPPHVNPNMPGRT